MLAKIAFMSLGILLGISIAAVINHGKDTSSQEITRMQRNAMIEAAMDALDTLQAGEIVAAQLMLASAVNAQAQITFRQPNASTDDLKSARDWQSRMQGHNERLKLKAAQDRPAR